MRKMSRKMRRDRRAAKSLFHPRSMNLVTALAVAGLSTSYGWGQLTGVIDAHDPSTIIKQGSTYYYYATGQGIISRTSTDRVNWSAGPSVFNTPPAWTTAAVSGFNGFFWAPDIAYFGGSYHLYYSASTFGTIDSGIGVATTPSLSNPVWTDQGKVVQSDAVGYTSPNTDTTAFNAIDPSILVDTNGRVYMSFGSYSSGILVTELDPTTGKRKNTSSLAATLVANNAPGGGWGSTVEASSLIQHGGYYYLFVNYGGCCNGIDSTYNIRVGRSTSPTGPFLDKNGVNMNNGGGSLFYDDDGSRTGPGHFAFYSEGGQDQFSYHYYDGNRSGAPAFGLSNLFWTGSAWPSVAAINPDWTGTTTANWSTATNWTDGTVPDGVGSVANFGTITSGRYAVTLDGAGKTLSRINFNGNGSFTIGTRAGNPITMTPMAGDVQATINDGLGTHAINQPIVATSDLGVNVSTAGDTLSLVGGVTAKSLIKYGRGGLKLLGAQSYTGSLFVHAGSVNVNGIVTTTAFNSVGQIVGDVGTLTVGNGTFYTTADLNIGDSGDNVTPATGTLNIGANGFVTVGTSGGFYVGSGFSAGSRALGTVNQTAGTLTANGNFDGGFVIGGRGSVNGTGTYNLSGGTVTANTNLFVGGYGSGTIAQTGGTFNASRFMSIGRFAGSTGSWNVANGTVNQTSTTAALIVGESGAGTLTIGGGGFIVSTGGVRVGLNAGSSGLVNLNTGGILATQSLTRGSGSASFNFDGGTLRATANSNDFYPFAPADSEIKAGGARIDTNGKTVRITKALDGIGGLTKDGAGSLTFSVDQSFTGGVTVNGGSLGLTRLINNGGVTLSGGQLDLLAPTTAYDPTHRSVVSSLAATAGTLDLHHNLLVIDYAAGNGDAQTAALRAMLIGGQVFNDGTLAANMAIGFLDTASLASLPTAFGTVDASSLIVRAALPGDANLDSSVTFDDLLILARNYGDFTTLKTWQNGDFDYNGEVGFSDLLALARTYNTTLSPDQASILNAAAGSSFTDDFSGDWALAKSLVPEPNTLATVIAASTLAMSRRRTSRFEPPRCWMFG